jgi:nucleotide-binding universal stress UspA family protein
MARPTKIVVAYDGSAHSKQALEWAIDLSRLSKGSVNTVYVAEPVHLYGVETGGAEMIIETLREVEERDQKTLQEAKAFGADRGIDIKTELLQGNIAQSIINYAKNEQADLIIAGTRGHGALDELLMGSVTRNLVSLAHIPVLVVKD